MERKERIAIIGAGGQMGKWLAGYFVKKGFEVTGFDTENLPGPSKSFTKSLKVTFIQNLEGKEMVLK